MEKRSARKSSLKTILLAGALALGSFDLEAIAQEGRPKSNSSKLVKTESKNNLSYLDVYDAQIDKSIEYFKKRHGVAPERNLVKAMIAEETGGLLYRNSDFVYDPMSISHKGDSALEVLASKGENTHIIGDFSNLVGKNTAPRVKGRWDYHNTGMTSEVGIYGGIGWLYHKSAVYSQRDVESGELKQYIVKKGDFPIKIAKNLGTTVGILKSYNKNISQLKVGQVLDYKLGKKETYVSSWRNWDEAVDRYNGGGNPNYMKEVLEIKKKLDSRN